MARVMMLVSAEGATMAETKVGGEGREADQVAEAQLREEARVSGSSEDEIKGAHLIVVGDFRG